MSASSDSAVFNVAGNNYLQFNNSVTDKGNRIGYNLANTGSSGMLDIIGNGSASSRSIKLWDTVTVNNGLTVSAGNLNVDEGVLYSGSKNTGGVGGGLNIYNKSTDTTASISSTGAIKGLTVESTQTITAGTGLTVTTGNLTISAGVLNSGSKLTGGVGGGLNIYNGTNNTTASISSAGAITCSSLSAGTGGITTTGDITTTSEGKITSAKLLTASNGFTATSGSININATAQGSVLEAITQDKSTAPGNLVATTSYVNNAISGNFVKLIDDQDIDGIKNFRNGIRIKESNIIELGYGLSKQVHAGKIGYNVFDSGYLSIVGSGNDSDRRVNIYDHLHVTGSLRIPNSKTIELGYGVASKNSDAGKILYNESTGYLDIVGAGTSTSNRKIKMWDNVYIVGGLSIDGHLENVYVGQHFFYNGIDGRNSGATNNGRTYPVSLKFSENDGCILLGGAAVIVINSDIRIKKDINNLDKKKLLDCIRNIKPVNYKLIESDEKISIGFIAQDVEKFIPEAVSLHSDYIPNFLSYGIVNTISSNKHEIFFDNEICCIDNNTPYNIPFNIKIKKDNIENTNCIVTEVINKQTVIIEGNIDNVIDDNKIYIYGSLVNDFRVLSKDVIFTYSVSAIQELDNLVQELQKENIELKSKIKSIEMRLEKAGI